MSLLKWKVDKNNWFTFYVDAIKNRLRRDKNLSDVFDVAESRKNLEIIGDNNQTHFHDNRYIPIIDELRSKTKADLDTLSVTLTNHASGGPCTRDSSNRITIPINNVVSDQSICNGSSDANDDLIAFASGAGVQPLMVNNNLYYNPSAGLLTSPNIYADKITGKKIYGAFWNDYAEFFPRGEKTEAGDIIMLDITSDSEEKYIKAVEGSICNVGIHSDEYGHLIGGEEAPKNKDFVEYNIGKYIPVGLIGRVKVKFTGKSILGGKVVPSIIPGVGRLYNSETDSKESIVGMLVESNNLTIKRKLKVKLV